MSITEHESNAITECIKQLKDCIEFLQKATDEIDNEFKELTISTIPPIADKKEHSKDYEKLRKTIKKIHKEAKQKIHNIGKCMKDSDENNLDATSVAEDEPVVEEVVVKVTSYVTGQEGEKEKDETAILEEKEREKETEKINIVEGDNEKESNKIPIVEEEDKDKGTDKIPVIEGDKEMEKEQETDKTANIEESEVQKSGLEENGHKEMLEANGEDVPEFLTNNTTKEGKESVESEMENKPCIEENKLKIRLVAIEKLLDPKVMASANSNTMMSIPLTRRPPLNLSGYTIPKVVTNTSTSIIILDSDEEVSEPLPLKSVPNGTREQPPVVQNGPKDNPVLANGGKENHSDPINGKETPSNQKLPKVKPLKIRINRCKVAEDLLKAGKRCVKLSKIAPKSRSRSIDSTEGNEQKRSHKRRYRELSTSDENISLSSGDDSDFAVGSRKRARREKDSHRKYKYSDKKRSHGHRSKSRRNHSDEDRLKKRKEDKEKEGRKKDDKRDRPSTSSKHRSKSNSSSHRHKITDDDDGKVGQENAEKHGDSLDLAAIEATLEEMETGRSKDDDSMSTTSKVSKSSKTPKADGNVELEGHKSESDKENARQKSNKNPTSSKSNDSSSDDETIINIKKKVVEKSLENKEKESEEDKKEKNSQDESENSDESSDEEIVKTRKNHSRNKRIRTSSASDSDENFESPDSEDSDQSSEDSDDNSSKKKKKNQSKKDKSDESDSDSDPQSKRKNIRGIIKTKHLDDCTKKATEAEKERRKRVEERQKLYNQIFEKPESAEIENAVLDFEPETKKQILSIDKGLVKKMKPHQVQGVKFMWDACFETIKDIKEKPGSGCILGHCMGLGKTLQVVALSHTLLAHRKKTSVNTVLVITPLSTVTNWAREFHMWIRYCKYKDIEVYDMSKYKDKKLRIYKLKEWQEDGGVCVIGYDMFRILANPKGAGGKKMREALQSTLVNPGPDVIVCDEGHLLKNEKTSISKAVSQVRTLRRIVLSGTPLQNNLKEYYCMVQFVKPNLLGTYKEYLNRFVNPITNGQYTDSTDRDIRLMKNRSHVLHKMLEGCIQRRDYSVLAPYLPQKHEYVVFISLSDLQKKLYEYYMVNERTVDQNGTGGKGTALFKDFQNLRRVWTHPMSLRVNSDEVKKKKDRKAFLDENSMEDFIVDDDGSTSSESDASSSGSDESGSTGKKKKTKTGGILRRTRQNGPVIDEGPIEDEDEACESKWWKSVCSESELTNIHHSPKLLLLFEILQECESIGDKVLLFSQSLQSLDVIEAFLALIHKKTQGLEDEACDVNGFIGSWVAGMDYFRLDGSSSVESRETMCRRFNSKSDYRSRLFLISTRAGSLGINLVAANRVIIFDASWNPSHDTQSIFRVYRFGQEKPCYIYRFIAKGTMEEKVYERQVMKQATAKRVIDEHQIGRHYNSNDLMELYQYDLSTPEVREVPILPKDRLFAELIKKHEQYIIKYHEHDSLLENKESENLNEEERKAAWAEFENEKNQPAPSQYGAYTRPNYRNGPVTSSKIFGFRSDVLLRLLNLKVRRDHPQLTDMEVGQLVPLYLRQLYEQMNSGVPTLYNELNELNRAFEMPSNFGVNPLSASNYIINPFYQPPVGQNTDPGYIHEID